MEVEDRRLLDQWIARWNDIIGFEILFSCDVWPKRRNEWR
jgi:hypothetical protein